jgi:hypothetical protein
MNKSREQAEERACWMTLGIHYLGSLRSLANLEIPRAKERRLPTSTGIERCCETSMME